MQTHHRHITAMGPGGLSFVINQSINDLKACMKGKRKKKITLVKLIRGEVLDPGGGEVWFLPPSLFLSLLFFSTWIFFPIPLYPLIETQRLSSYLDLLLILVRRGDAVLDHGGGEVGVVDGGDAAHGAGGALVLPALVVEPAGMYNW
jgi:hypothetical protein